jgi:Mn-containing catalase
MFLCIEKLPVQLPASPKVAPIAARNVPGLSGGRFGEMSALMNYAWQSLAMRGREKIRALRRPNFQHCCRRCGLASVAYAARDGWT